MAHKSGYGGRVVKKRVTARRRPTAARAKTRRRPTAARAKTRRRPTAARAKTRRRPTAARAKSRPARKKGQTKDNRITNRLVRAGRLPKSQMENVPQKKRVRRVSKKRVLHTPKSPKTMPMKKVGGKLRSSPAKRRSYRREDRKIRNIKTLAGATSKLRSAYRGIGRIKKRRRLPPRITG
jgi:hypothetical protein